MTQNSDLDLRLIYRIAMYAAGAMLVIIFLQIMIFIIAPPPSTVLGFFELFHQNPYLGLLSLDFLYLFNNMIIVILYLALFFRLLKAKPVLSWLAFIAGLLGVACYYPSNPAFEMLRLSSLYFQSPVNTQVIYLAAGEAVMAGYTGTAFNAYYVFSTISLLLFASAIIKSHQFKKSTGWWGLASGLLMIIPSSAGTLGLVSSFLSLIPWVVFVSLLIFEFKSLNKI